MAGIGSVQEWRRPDMDDVSPRYRRKMEQKFGERVRFRWLGDHTCAKLGLRQWTPVERDPEDPEQHHSPDGRVRSGDRFLGAMPESAAQQRDAYYRAKRMKRLQGIVEGAHLGAEITKMIRKGLFTPRHMGDGFDQRGFMCDLRVGAHGDGIEDKLDKTPWFREKGSNAPTPNELGEHLDTLRSAADIPEASDVLRDNRTRQAEAVERWMSGKQVFGTQENPDTLGKSLRKRGDE